MEPWNREHWLEWIDLLLEGQWERPADWDWEEFRSDWMRDLFHSGKEADFGDPELR